MSNNQTLPQKKETDPAPRVFRQTTHAIAGSLLRDWVGDERAQEAMGRIAAAISASASAARNPSDFYECTPQSVGTCIAKAALTGIMPGGGSSALAYVFPRRPRRGEPPQLQYELSHRGINALARRCGMTMIPIPISHSDSIVIDNDGQARILSCDADDPPTEWEELRGVVVICRDLKANQIVHRGWVPKKLIEQRRKMSLSDKSDFSPWNNWPIEMAMKTALHYAIGRGWCVIDDTEATRALSMDSVKIVDAKEVDRSQTASEPPVGRVKLPQTNNNHSENNQDAQEGQEPEPENLEADTPPEFCQHDAEESKPKASTRRRGAF